MRLTELSSCAGCAAKLRPDALTNLLAQITGPRPKQALVGFETRDDAAVWQVSKELAIVNTVDFFPPIVDDPFSYGEIAAANAMSDIWAMGGKALYALNIVAFPKTVPAEVLEAILAGGASKAREAGVAILGGHSIQATEPAYGLAVTGSVHPKRVLTNAKAKPGDYLLLTKPLGTGIATTAIKRGLASEELQRSVTTQMATLNKKAGEVFASGKFQVNALTDVTGFGLLGHLLGMVRGSKVKATLELEALPILGGVPALAEQGVVPGGTKTNLEYVTPHVRFPDGLPEAIAHVLADAQTNGGLLASVPEKAVHKALAALERAKVDAWVVGYVEKGKAGITVA